MVEEVIITSRKGKIYLKYDKEKYNIEYVKNAHIILLRRLFDNQIIQVFSEDIGFIIQSNKEGEIHFLVTDYSEKDQNGIEMIRFKHYMDERYRDELLLKNTFECDSVGVSTCRITDSSYLVEQSGYTGCIYNLKEKSKRYNRIYNDQKLNKFFNDNTLLVSEKIYPDINRDIYDNITYGINPETFEVTTPIWSELQQRYIRIYTKKEVEKLKEKLFHEGLILNEEDFGRITIYQEVRNCLNKIANQFDRAKSVYTDTMQDEVNEEFIKQFVKNNETL